MRENNKIFINQILTLSHVEALLHTTRNTTYTGVNSLYEGKGEIGFVMFSNTEHVVCSHAHKVRHDCVFAWTDRWTWALNDPPL